MADAAAVGPEAPLESEAPAVPPTPVEPLIATPDAVGPCGGAVMFAAAETCDVQVKAAEKAALNVHKKLTVQAAPIRQYLVRARDAWDFALSP